MTTQEQAICCTGKHRVMAPTECSICALSGFSSCCQFSQDCYI